MDCDGGEVVEGVEAVGAAAEFARGLRAAQHEEAEDGGLVAAEVEDGADAVLVLGDAAVVDGGDEGEVVEGVERLADLVFGEFEHRVAAGALVAGVDECVQRERVVLRGGDLFFDERAEDADLDGVELHIYRVPQSGLGRVKGAGWPVFGQSVAQMTQKLHLDGNSRAVWEGWFDKMDKANGGN